MTQRRVPEPESEAGVAYQRELGGVRGGETVLNLGGYYAPTYRGGGFLFASGNSLETETSLGAGSVSLSGSGVYFGSSANVLFSAFQPTTTTTITFTGVVSPNVSGVGVSPFHHRAFFSGQGGYTSVDESHRKPRKLVVESVQLTPNGGASAAFTVPPFMNQFREHTVTTTGGGTVVDDHIGMVAYDPTVRATVKTPGGGAPDASFAYSNLQGNIAGQAKPSFDNITNSISAREQVHPDELDPYSLL